MKQYDMTVGYYKSIDDFELRHKSFRDEDDHIRGKKMKIFGDSAEDCARKFFGSLIDNGGKIVRYIEDPYAIGIEENGVVYESVDVWTDDRNAHGFHAYHFYK